MEKLRRELIKLSIATTLTAISLPLKPLEAFAKTTSTSSSPAVMNKERTVAEILGVHDAPGRSHNTHWAAEHFKTLAPSSVLTIDPSAELIETVRSVPIIFRHFTPDNQWNQTGMEDLISNIHAAGIRKGFVVQFLNEPNLLKETGEKPLDPERAIKRFVAGARFIADRGGIALWPPLAQYAKKPDRDDIEYAKAMYEAVRRYADREWLEANTIRSEHLYLMNPGEPIDKVWERAIQRNKDFERILGFTLPTIVTESGIHRSRNDRFSDEAVTQALKRFWTSGRVPSALKIISIHHWNYADKFQLPIEAWTTRDQLYPEYEAAALVKASKDSSGKVTPIITQAFINMAELRRGFA